MKPLLTQRYCVVKKFTAQYNQFLKEKRSSAGFYAHPRKSTPRKDIRIYLGLGREERDIYDEPGAGLSDEEEKLLELIEEDQYTADKIKSDREFAEKYNDLFEDAKDYELIFARIKDTGTDGASEKVPANMQFIGYDVTFDLNTELFSAISDSMFFPVWKGCDPDGTAFAESYKKLNKYGLFDNTESAGEFMKLYGSYGWSEKGDFYITEIWI